MLKKHSLYLRVTSNLRIKETYTPYFYQLKSKKSIKPTKF